MLDKLNTSFKSQNEEIAIALANKILNPFGFICEIDGDGEYGIEAWHSELKQSYFIPFNNDGSLDEQQLYRLPVKIAYYNCEQGKAEIQKSIKHVLNL